MVREAEEKDLQELLHLYLYLHEKEVPEMTPHLEDTWKRIMEDPNHHIIVAQEGNHIVSSCVCVVIPNLTRDIRPYAFVENVVTSEAFRGRGLATACLDYAKKIAQENGCYKMMLLTGSKEKSTLDFYRRAGFNSEDKTAFIQWI